VTSVDLSNESPLRLRELYAGKRLVVIGGTGFLGKVWWSLLLDRLPEVGKVFLVVRPKSGGTSEQRFWNEIAPHPCLQPLQDRYGADYETFLRSKVVPVDGDITQPFCGLSESLREELHGTIDAVVNASGIVNFQPPLDVALEVNAFGAQTVVDLARDLGGVAVLHTSTCYVAGYRPGIVEEANPLEHPFPFAGKLERAHWDADREIAECLDIIKQAKQRAGDAFRQSHFLDQAKKNLLERGEPCSGAILEEEIARVRRKFVETQLSQLGQERAQFWGWPNTYTYTKSIGEQIIARSGLPFTIVRPAIIESCVEYPSVGWNEGVNTSAPIIYAIRQGQQQLPGDSVRLDLIPCDFVASGMILSLAELFEGRAKPVYQYGTSDSNPVTMSRVYELSGLHKRKLYLRTGQGGPLVSFLQAHLEGALLEPDAFEKYGPKRVAAVAKGLASWLENLPEGGLSLSLEPAAAGLRKFARKQENIAKVVGQFIPFTAELDYEFRCDNTRSALARALPEEQALLYWAPERLDWRDWFLNTHVPGLDKWVFPELEAKLKKRVKALRHHETLVHLIREMADRHQLAVALQDQTDAGLTRVSYRELYELASACAVRLKREGVSQQTVALLADNQTNWVVALFGILLTGAQAVLLDANGSPADIAQQARAAGASLVLHDAARAQTAHRVTHLNGNVRTLSLDELCKPATEAPSEVLTWAAPRPDQIAVVTFTRGTASEPRAVAFSHAHLVQMLGAIAPLFPVSHRDRFLTVQALIRPNQLLCALLLPLSRGAQVVFTRHRDVEHLLELFRTAHITATSAGPRFWDKLVAALCQASHHSRLRKRWLRAGLNVSTSLRRTLGWQPGPLLLSSVHNQLGGRVRLLINSGGPLSEPTRRTLQALGLPLANCYGLTESGPLAVSPVGTRRRPADRRARRQRNRRDLREREYHPWRSVVVVAYRRSRSHRRGAVDGARSKCRGNAHRRRVAPAVALERYHRQSRWHRRVHHRPCAIERSRRVDSDHRPGEAGCAGRAGRVGT
jgi:long-chain acyl-CoA synthetase